MHYLYMNFFIFEHEYHELHECDEYIHDIRCIREIRAIRVLLYRSARLHELFSPKVIITKLFSCTLPLPLPWFLPRLTNGSDDKIVLENEKNVQVLY